MPDRDIVHPLLSFIFQKPYKLICEGHDSLEEQARILAKALRKTLIEYGNDHLRSLDDLCRLLNDIVSQPLFLPVENWHKRNFEIERLIGRMNGNSRAIALLKGSAKDIVHEIRNGGQIDNFRREILIGYIDRIYNADFVERVPLNQNHYNDISQQELDARINEIKPFLLPHIETFADKIARTGNTNSMSVPKHPNEGQPFDIHANIFDM